MVRDQEPRDQRSRRTHTEDSRPASLEAEEVDWADEEPPSARPRKPMLSVQSRASRGAQVGGDPAPAFLNPREFRGSYLPDWLLARPDTEVSAGAKIVYVSLLRHFNRRRGYAFPGLVRVGKQVGQSPRQVGRHIKTLKRLGLIVVTPTGRSNQYRFPWHPWMKGAQLKPKAITRTDT